MDSISYAVDLAKVVYLFTFIMGLASILTWMEAKQSAVMQDRIGRNRADIFGVRALGLMHLIADAVKMLIKEDFIPAYAHRFLHRIAPFIAFFFALMAFSAIPFGGTYRFGGYEVTLQVFSFDAALLFVFAMMSLGIYGFVLGGWASANNYSLLGGLRASSQMISYEITLGATVIGALMIYGTLDLQQMIVAQGELFWGWIPQWGVFLQPVGCLLFMTAALVETKRVPFDIPEGESEIIGYFLEYSGMRFGLFFLTDFVETVLAACMTTILFFGGWQVPYLGATGFAFPGGSVWELSTVTVMILQLAAFAVKVFLLCFFFLLVRWTLPRFRWDQLMRLGWTLLLPLSIANILVTGLVLLWLQG